VARPTLHVSGAAEKIGYTRWLVGRNGRESSIEIRANSGQRAKFIFDVFHPPPTEEPM
jgi:hypothetical protein